MQQEYAVPHKCSKCTALSQCRGHAWVQEDAAVDPILFHKLMTASAIQAVTNAKLKADIMLLAWLAAAAEANMGSKSSKCNLLAGFSQAIDSHKPGCPILALCACFSWRAVVEHRLEPTLLPLPHQSGHALLPPQAACLSHHLQHSHYLKHLQGQCCPSITTAEVLVSNPLSAQAWHHSCMHAARLLGGSFLCFTNPAHVLVCST